MENLNLLVEYFKDPKIQKELKPEIVSSIGRQKELKIIFDFIKYNVFCSNKRVSMDCVYQMYRTCLYKSKYNKEFLWLEREIRVFYKNEVINKMYEYFFNKQKPTTTKKDYRPTIFEGDNKKILKKLKGNSIQLIFTSPPYYNAKEYSEYTSYKNYLQSNKDSLVECNRVLEEGRFIIINISPVISKRPGREFESIRYPIHFDFHKILEESNFYFVDEILWIKPEPSVPNRNGGYIKTRTPLTYKPNCITESLLVYRKNCNFLIDETLKQFKEFDKFNDSPIDTSNCWYIPPTRNKNHSAVFPKELCEKVLRYYSFEGDVVLDPFSGSGTVAEVAIKMNRIPLLCEKESKYVEYTLKKYPFLENKNPSKT